MRISRVAVAAVSTVALGIIAAPVAQATPGSAHPTVAYNWWKGRHEQKHYYGSVRPSVWGSSFGEPITSLRWSYWNRNSAKGKGLLIHMSCQPCHETVYLHDVRTSHGTRYFEKATEPGRTPSTCTGQGTTGPADPRGRASG
jgi:hypothetical protein